MCGITGIYTFNNIGKQFIVKTLHATSLLNKRGPDSSNYYRHNNVALGHTRLSIIDVTDAASQPFTDNSKRYTIIYNGEIYNFKELRIPLIEKGVIFCSNSDTEVLLYLYITEGPAFLNKLNGFFSFAIYDKVEESLFIARDRLGIKPLIYFRDNDKLIFASEMKSILAYGIQKDIDYVSLNMYLQLNYIPAPDTIFKNVFKLTPGTYLLIKKDENSEIIIHNSFFYKIPRPYPELRITNSELNYEEAQKNIFNLVDASVKKRLIADVPLGAFLSGGIDSSIIVSIASRLTNHLNTFSIGFKDEPMFDETYYSRLVAKKFNTNHTEFSLTTDDIFGILYNVLDYIDEPFADSSALAVYILSKYTRQHVTVALSGDGADELFGGYNKHYAEYKARHSSSLVKWFIGSLGDRRLLSFLPQSRNSGIGNKIRQINRYAQGLKLNDQERYWRWCSFIEEDEADTLINNEPDRIEYLERKNKITKYISSQQSTINGQPFIDLNDILYSDMHLVLQNDMLTKVDLMSMANSLEVRVPFLDHELVNYVFSLPSEYKIDSSSGKKILKDTFRQYLPDEIFNRGKHGFEVPLLKWFRTELKTMILDDLLKDDFIIEQNIFNLDSIRKLKRRLFSNNPGDVHAQIWGLIVFQYWWKKYIQ